MNVPFGALADSSRTSPKKCPTTRHANNSHPMQSLAQAPGRAAARSAAAPALTRPKRSAISLRQDDSCSFDRRGRAARGWTVMPITFAIQVDDELDVIAGPCSTLGCHEARL
jgi:hypothetical protein